MDLLPGCLIRARAIAIVAVLSLGGVAHGQTTRGGASPRRPTGLATLLTPTESGTDWRPSAPPVRATAPAAPAAGSARPGARVLRDDRPAGSPTERDLALDASIAALATELGRMRSEALETIDMVDDMSQLVDMAGEFHRRHEVMRERLYLGDPRSDSAAARAIGEFDAVWGRLAPTLWAGSRQSGLIGVPAWEAAKTRVRRVRCPLPDATIPDVVAAGILDGPAWACTTNAYMSDLADLEARVNSAQSVGRLRALEPLTRALEDLDDWMGRTRTMRAGAPDHAILRRQFTSLLRTAWLAGAQARLDELRRLRDSDTSSPFQRFARHAPRVPQAPVIGTPALALPAGSTLTARLGSSQAQAQVVSPPYGDDGPGLARELHDVHYLLRTLEAYVLESDAEALRQAPDEPDPSAAVLSSSRPVRVAAARATLEERRDTLVARIAAR